MAPAADRNGNTLIEAGTAENRGATPGHGGVNFAVYSSSAELIELCLFDGERESTRLPLPHRTGNTWHGWVPGCEVGQAYGFRAHGPYAPEDGLRFNPHKLLLDPYAKSLRGEFTWSPAVYDYAQPSSPELVPSELDSGPFMPKSVVTDSGSFPPARRAAIPWRDMVIYEANVRGYTMRHPGIPDADRGRFRGMRNGQILDYLRSLGITSLELMPVFEFIDEQHLHERGLRNLWGYNSVNFFTPATRYQAGDDLHEFREMVDAIHDAGIEVILDVAYNHTGEGGRLGPTLNLRGLDNRTYYRTSAERPGEYVNDTGCGNTLDADQTAVQELIVDSLRYWHRVMGADGFRFDLATVLGRSADGFRKNHPLLRVLSEDQQLRDVKLIAEPWDPGPGGYQLGRFPPRWAEWNDRYRDDVRRFWRGDADSAPGLARSLHGSSDLFEHDDRSACSSINFVTCHDGFTLTDLVSYESRHNAANGEGNRDGHRHNLSSNSGVEGDTDDAEILAHRRQRRLNLLATLLFSQGTPMLLGGDEFGNSQQGNNNAYAQDNPVGWVDWSGLDGDPEFVETVRALIRVRRGSDLLRRDRYAHGDRKVIGGHPDFEWYAPDGKILKGDTWQAVRAFSAVLAETDESCDELAIAILINGQIKPVIFKLPAISSGFDWKVRFASAAPGAELRKGGGWQLAGESIACLRLRRD